ncbi:MAG: IS200/IS605 family transposase [Saprospiraceae bacterium]
MANTYSQLYVQIVFTVRGRKHMIHKKYKDDLERYITSVVQLGRTKMIQIYCMPDHIHILIGLHPSESISQIVQKIKVSSTKFLKKQDVIFRNFSWQKGFGAFSYAHSQLGRIATYVQNQEAHHRRKTFKQEYIKTLEKFNVSYDEKYLFDFYDSE